MVILIKAKLRPAFHLYLRGFRAFKSMLAKFEVKLRWRNLERVRMSFPSHPDDNKLVDFVAACQTKKGSPVFRYALRSQKGSLYASVYACLISEFMPDLACRLSIEPSVWRRHFDKYQDPITGYFIDPEMRSRTFTQTDWWGARHLALHMANAYRSFNAVPPHRFHFLKDFKYPESFDVMFEVLDDDILSSDSDVDNQFMNVVCLMQFERDYFAATDHNEIIASVKRRLLQRINPATGLWGGTPRNQAEASRAIQVAYHLLPIYAYDDQLSFDFELIVQGILKVENTLGGFGSDLNSSACEDIDASDLLILAYPFVSEETQSLINQSLKRHSIWVASNQMSDGGFTFRRLQSFTYGHSLLHADRGCGAMFPTWFRALSSHHMRWHFGNVTRLHHTSPGYYFLKEGA